MTKFEICIPTYNEASVIMQTINELSKHLDDDQLNIEGSIAVADSDSKDGTVEIIAKADTPVRLITSKKRGKGYALKEAFVSSAHPIVGFIDVDLSVDPKGICTFVHMINNNEANVVIGSRFHPESVVNRNIIRKITSRAFNLGAKIFLGSVIDDNQCPLKIMDEKGKAVFISCKEDTFFTDIEFLCRASKAGLKIKQVPIVWEENRYVRKSKTSVIREGMKGVFALMRLRKNLKNHTK